MGKSAKKATMVEAAHAKVVKKGKRAAEVALEKNVRAKKQKRVVEAALKKKRVEAKTQKKPAKAQAFISSDEESDEEPKVKVPPKKAAVAAKPPVESSSDDDSSSEGQLPAKKHSVASAKNGTKVAPFKEAKQASSSSSESESDDDSDSEEEEEEEKEEEEESSDEEDAKPAKKAPQTPGTLQAKGASKTLFIGNLSFSVERADVEKFFKDYEVVDVRLATDREGVFRGYGHVEFATAEAAKKAVVLREHELLGRPVILG